MAFERVYALVCNYEKKLLNANPSIFNNIMDYPMYGYTFEDYISDQANNIDRKLELTKICTGR
jgi:hypothetical protein